MPRRLPVRPAKVFGNFFVLVVLALMGLIYYTFVFVIYAPKAKGKSPPDISAILFIPQFFKVENF